MSLFPHEDVLTKEIETWRGFIDKLPSDDDKLVFKKLLNDCYKYSVAINSQAQSNIFLSVSIASSSVLYLTGKSLAIPCFFMISNSLFSP